jgi:hypothetical protein
MMDGPVVQEAALRALDAGTTFDSISSDLEHVDLGVPLIAMTYYNIFLHNGVDRAAGQLANSGISGAIVPDLSLEETGDWRDACDKVDVATVLLVAPSTPHNRLVRLAHASQGFLYASARMAVTGRSEGDGEGARVVQSIRDVSDIPAFIGIGIGTPEQARTRSGCERRGHRRFRARTDHPRRWRRARRRKVHRRPFAPRSTPEPFSQPGRTPRDVFACSMRSQSPVVHVIITTTCEPVHKFRSIPSRMRWGHWC